ncbi:MAG: DUF3108 domain-containing protein [candidate division WOR-3 bacterium]
MKTKTQNLKSKIPPSPFPSLICLLACLLACVPEPAQQKEPLRNAPLTPHAWQDGETSIYEVVRNDSLLLQRIVSLDFDEEDGIASLVVTSSIRSESVPYYFLDSTVFSLSRFSLKPLWSYRMVATEISLSEVKAEFYTDRVEMEKEVVEGTDKKTLPINENTWGVEMLQQLLRALPLEPGRSYQLTAVLPMEFRTTRVEVTVLGTKTIKTPLGEFLCREVELTSRDRKLRLVYELADPHRLIAIRDQDNLTDTRLIDFYITTPDTLMPES